MNYRISSLFLHLLVKTKTEISAIWWGFLPSEAQHAFLQFGFFAVWLCMLCCLSILNCGVWHL